MKPNITQIMAAALVSPLAVFIIVPVSLITGLTGASQNDFRGGAASSLLLVMTLLPYVYLMMLVVGVPAALLARRYNFTSVWFAAATGFVCPWIAFAILFVSGEIGNIPLRLASLATWAENFYYAILFSRSVLIPLSGLGFVIGTVFWLIASLRFTGTKEA